MNCPSATFLTIALFLWIWSLPLLLLCTFFLMPVAVCFLPISLTISLFINSYYPVTTRSRFRTLVSSLHLHKWFPCNIVPIGPQMVIAVHPHGLLCCGALAGIHFAPGSTTVLCVAPSLFYIPILGWSLHLLGCIPAKYNRMLHVLKEGHSLIVVPGGVPEIVMAEMGQDCSLYPRHGFLKLAKVAGVPIMSVFVKGECSTFKFVPLPFWRQRTSLSWWLNLPLVFPYFFGHWGTFLPKRVPLQLKTHVMQSVPSRNQYRVRLASLMLENKNKKL
jgi:hypothetical protein